MKAIIFNRNGFRKDTVVEKETPYLRSFNNIPTICEVREHDIDLVLEATEYQLIRSFVNEYDEKILIYKEMP